MTSLYEVPQAVPYYQLNVSGAFKELTPKQRLYAHYMVQASWIGTSICASQLSPESLPLLRHFYELFKAHPVEEVKQKALQAGVTPEEVSGFLDYVAMLYSSMGNYVSFGDSKFIPRCSKDAFTKIVLAAQGNAFPEALTNDVFDISESKRTLDFPPSGISAYYSPNITQAEALLANEFLSSKAMDGVNTRVFKKDNGDLEIRVAAATVKTIPPESFQGRNISIYYGDFQDEMGRVVQALQSAKQYAENDTQVRMLDHYIAHFQYGDVQEHKESQKEWVKDLGPVVETNIGFIESYRDPSGVRAEWEGFVSIVNKAQSIKYGTLVANAEKFIPKLPWGKAFEKDAFTSPDFTSLEIVAFASSGIPSGICIPNYDDVRQEFGFKNVYLSNIVNAINFNEKISHITDKDWEIYKDGFIDAMSVNVGVHELLGHGTGKLYMQKEDGSLNFDKSTIDPISGKPVATWYKPGDTFGTVFGGLGSSYEECRAEAVALYLGIVPELLQVFQVENPEARRKTIHVLWLNMVRAGLVGLEFYTPETQQWRQAHMRARFCILQVLLRANTANPLVTIRKDDKEGLIIEIDADRIENEGVKAIGDLLLNLNVNKSLANATRGSAYYEDLTSVNDEFVEYRELIMARRKPRKQFVQPHTVLTADGKDAELVEFDGSVEGAINAMVRRHSEIKL
eukprot:gene11883-8168_t